MRYVSHKGVVKRFKNFQKTFINVNVALVLALTGLSGLLPFFLAKPASAAAPGVIYTDTSFSTLTFNPDRSAPSGGYTVAGDTLTLNVDNTKANTSDQFYQTEGVQSTIPVGRSISAELYIDPSWASEPVRAGLWGIAGTPEGIPTDVAWPIIEYTTIGDGNFTGWRVFDTMRGGWTNLTAAHPQAGNWYRLEIAYNNVTHSYGYYVNGSLLVSKTAIDDTVSTKPVYSRLQGVIFNNYNSATDNAAADNYTVQWRNFQTGSPDTSKISFVNDPKYVRQNNPGDLSAQVVTYDDTSAVQFYIDGDTSKPLVGSDAGPSSSGYHWWRLYASIPAGQHTVTGRVQINDRWYEIPDSAIVYSLDTPDVSYVYPSSTSQRYFRPGDNPVRVKVDDEFNQFKSLQFSLYNYNTATNSFGTHLGSYTVNRDQCDLRAAGNYVLCDIKNSSAWNDLVEGTYATKLTTYDFAGGGIRTSMSQGWSEPFTVDSTPPTLTNFHITNVHPVYSNSVNVSADATDANGVKDVTFYVTAPRVSDNACDGNGTSLVTALGNLSSGSTYTATLNTSDLNGDYCLNAIAGDVAANHSAISHIKATFDNTAPAVPNDLNWLDSNNHPATNGFTNVQKGTLSWKDATPNDVDHYVYKFWTNIPGYFDGQANAWTTDSSAFITQSPTGGSIGTDFYNKEGAYFFCVEAVDAAGNTSACSDTYSVTYDNTTPVVKVTSPASDDVVRGTVVISGTVTDDNPDHYYLVVQDGAGKYVAGPKTVNQEAVGDYAWDTTNVPDGEYTIRLEARDKAGNKSEASIDTVKVTVDNSKPTVKVNLNRKSYVSTGAVVGPNQKPEVEAFDAHLAKIEVTKNGKEVTHWTNVQPGKTTYKGIGWLGEGTYVIRAYDAAGNPSDDFQITIDKTAPDVAPVATLKDNNNVNIQTNGYIATKDFTFNLSSSPDVTRYQLKYWNSIPGSPFNGENRTWNPSNLSAAGHMSTLGVYTDNFTQGEGTHYFAFSACDAADNCSAYSTPFVVTYDNTAPTVTVNALTTNDQTPTVTGTVDDPEATVRVTVNEKEYLAAVTQNGTSSTWSADITDELQPGTYDITVSATDKAGNPSSDTAKLTVESTTPGATTDTNTTPGSPARALLTASSSSSLQNPGLVAAAPAAPAAGQVLGDQTNTPTETANPDAGGKVKGAETILNNAPDQEAKTATNSSAFLGLGWWWIAVIAAIFALYYLLNRRADNRKA